MEKLKAKVLRLQNKIGKKKKYFVGFLLENAFKPLFIGLLRTRTWKYFTMTECCRSVQHYTALSQPALCSRALVSRPPPHVSRVRAIHFQAITRRAWSTDSTDRPPLQAIRLPSGSSQTKNTPKSCVLCE